MKHKEKNSIFPNKPFSVQEKDDIEKEYKNLFIKNHITDDLKTKYSMILQNVFNYRKYVDFEKNCKIINSINRLEKINGNFKCLVLKSKMKNVKECEAFNFYDLNQKYIEDYEENKNNIDSKEYRSGEKILVNPFHDTNLLIMLEDKEKIIFADEMSFCERSAIKNNFIEALKYYYVPTVINDIEKSIGFKLEEKYFVYQFEVGVLDDVEDKECYSSVWDRKHSYYNENSGFCQTYEEASDYVKEYIKKGVTNTYGIISRLEVDKESYDSIYDGWSDSIDLEYELEQIVYNSYKNDKEVIVENFINLNVNSIELDDEEDNEI